MKNPFAQRLPVATIAVAVLLFVASLGLDDSSASAGDARVPAAPPVAVPLATATIHDHALSAVSDGNEVMLFGRNDTNQLYYKETSGRAFNSGWNEVKVSGVQSPDVVASRPEAVQVVAGHIMVFFRSTTNELMYWERDAGVWSLHNLGGIIQGSPVAEVDSQGAVVAVALNGAGAPCFRALVASGWNPWSCADGNLTGRLELTRDAAGTVQLYGRNGSGAMFRRNWIAGTDAFENSWTILGGVFASNPAAAVSGDGLVALGLNPAGVTFYRSTTDAAWNSAGGALAGNLDAVTGAGHVVFAGVNDGQQLFANQYTAGAGVATWTPLGGIVSTGPEMLSMSSTNDDVYVFVLNNDRSVWYRHFDGASWDAWTRLHGVFAFDDLAAPAVASAQ